MCSDLLPSTPHISLRLLSTLVPLMLLLTALRSLIPLSKRLPLLLSHALPSITMNWLKLSLMLVQLDFLFFAFRNPNLPSRESQPPLLVK